MDLPALKESVKEFAKEIFSLLHKYAVAGLSKGDNFDLVLIAFKVRNIYFRIPCKKIRILVFFRQWES